MVFTGTLRACFLLSCLLIVCMRESQAQVNLESLSSLVSEIHNRYNPYTGQYAVAFHVPANLCNHKPQNSGSISNLFKDDVAKDVKQAMNSETRIYEGKDLIGARPKPDGKTNGNYHSEYLLLNPTNPSTSPMQKLLKKYPNDCVVFYTFYSPCVNTCLNPFRERNIIKALDMFKKHKGPKALVFRHIFHYDADKPADQWAQNMKQVNAKVPLYHCNGSVCKPSVTNGVFDLTLHSSTRHN